MTHPNEELFRQGYAAFSRGDMDAIRAQYFADDIVWHSPGANPLSGDFHGIDAVLANFGKAFELSGGSFNLEVHDCIANDEHGVVLGVVRGERNGVSLEDMYTHVVHFRDGKVSESWIMGWDQNKVDDFWA